MLKFLYSYNGNAAHVQGEETGKSSSSRQEKSLPLCFWKWKQQIPVLQQFHHSLSKGRSTYGQDMREEGFWCDGLFCFRGWGFCLYFKSGQPRNQKRERLGKEMETSVWSYKKRKSIVSEGAIARGFSLKLPELVWTSCDLAEVSVGSLKDCIFLVDVLTKRKSLNLWL